MPAVHSRRRPRGALRPRHLTSGPFVRLLVLSLGVVLFGFLALCLWIRWQGLQEEVVPSDAIVVLGAAQWNGRPSPVLQARLDRAIELYRQGYAPLLILTGGSVPGDERSEASVGRDYAISAGVSPGDILTEEESRTTLENLEGVRELLPPHQSHSILLVSDPFHMGRALYIARQVGLTPHPAPTQSSPISERPLEETAYVVREALALLTYVCLGR